MYNIYLQLVHGKLAYDRKASPLLEGGMGLGALVVVLYVSVAFTT